MSNSAAKKLDSNLVGLSFAEEASLGCLPDDVANSGDEAGGIWYPLDPNEYDDFGAEIAMVARNPINASRQKRKGVVTDSDSEGGFEQDLTFSNLTRLMQGFFFADAHERPTSKPINGKAANTVGIVSVAGASSTLTLSNGDGAKLQEGSLVKLSSFVNSANNGFAKVTAIAADAVTIDLAGMVDEINTTGTIETVGFEYDAGATLRSPILTPVRTVKTSPVTLALWELPPIRWN